MAPAQGDLKEVLLDHVFPLDITRALVGGRAMAVAYVHSCGYVHGGLLLPFDPRNLMANMLG